MGSSVTWRQWSRLKRTPYIICSKYLEKAVRFTTCPTFGVITTLQCKEFEMLLPKRRKEKGLRDELSSLSKASSLWKFRARLLLHPTGLGSKPQRRNLVQSIVPTVLVLAVYKGR